jgi:hypothetical protein
VPQRVIKITSNDSLRSSRFILLKVLRIFYSKILKTFNTGKIKGLPRRLKRRLNLVGSTKYSFIMALYGNAALLSFYSFVIGTLATRSDGNN